MTETDKLVIREYETQMFIYHAHGAEQVFFYDPPKFTKEGVCVHGVPKVLLAITKNLPYLPYAYRDL